MDTTPFFHVGGLGFLVSTFTAVLKANGRGSQARRVAIGGALLGFGVVIYHVARFFLLIKSTFAM